MQKYRRYKLHINVQKLTLEFDADKSHNELIKLISEEPGMRFPNVSHSLKTSWWNRYLKLLTLPGQ